MAECVGQQGDVGTGGLAHLRDRVDERDFGRQKGVRGDLDQLCGLQVGHQEGNPGIQHRCIQLTDRGLSTRRTILYTKHNAIRLQGVVYRETFP